MGNYVFLSPGSEIIDNMFGDFRENEKVEYIEEPICIYNKKLRDIFIVFSKINNRFPLHCNKIWYPFFSLSKVPLSGKIVIFTNGVFNYYDKEYIDFLKKKNGSFKTVCIFLDPIHRLVNRHKLDEILSVNIDKILTFDNNDAKKMNWQYIGNIYSTYDTVEAESNVYDLYFLGVNKDDRLTLLLKLLKKSEGVKTKFILTRKKDEHCDLIQNGGISYKNNIELLQKSNCILELVQDGQIGATARYCEAVVFNKKLLTNNEHVKELPYYNEKYIRVFHSVDEIDLSWIKRRDEVNYNYRGDFSPLKILDLVEKK